MKDLSEYKSKLTRHAITLAGLTPAGKRAVLDVLRGYGLADYIPRDWNWGDEIRGSTNAPKLATRIANYLMKESGTKLPARAKEAIGNAANTHKSEAATYHFDFTHAFDWTDGDFGDGGSCFWGDDHKYALQTLSLNGVWAMRFFKKADSVLSQAWYTGKNDRWTGYARAWLAETAFGHIVFNGYGLQTIDIARVYADWQGLDYKRIGLENNGSRVGEVYINNSGHGYLVGETDTIAPVTRVDLTLAVIVECDYCYQAVPEADLRDGACPTCLEKRGEPCALCQKKTIWRYSARLGAREYQLCNDCLGNETHYCEECMRRSMSYTIYEPERIFSSFSSRVVVCSACVARGAGRHSRAVYHRTEETVRREHPHLNERELA